MYDSTAGPLFCFKLRMVDGGVCMGQSSRADGSVQMQTGKPRTSPPNDTQPKSNRRNQGPNARSFARFYLLVLHPEVGPP